MNNKAINTNNAEEIIMEHNYLRFTVLGGVRIEGLDRMRITLKVELIDSSRPAIRHNLDLYNDNQLEKFIRKIAERFEIGTSVISSGLSDLTGELERYRIEMLKCQKSEQVQIKQLTQLERDIAIEELKSSQLIKNTLNMLQSTGIQGEEKNSMILFISMTSRKTSDPLSVLCLAKSGMGKSYLMEKISECIPKEDTQEHTQFSGNSFYYYRREEIKGKVFLIEDLDGAQSVMFPIRELQTKKRISKTVTLKDKNGHLRTITLIVEGPVSVIACTTREKIYEDNANRALMIHLDGSKEQDERVMEYQKRLRAGIIDTQKEKEIQEKLCDMQRVLEPLKIINPYAPLIFLPKETFKPRRTLILLLSFMDALAFYNQYQRKKNANKNTGELYIEVHPKDVEDSFDLLEDVLFRKSDELSGASREFYQWLKQWNGQNKYKIFFSSDIRKDNRIQPRTLNRYLQELADYGLLQIVGGNKHRSGYSYKIMHGRDNENLKKSIKEQIECIIKNVWQKHKQIELEEKKQLENHDAKMPVRHQLDTNSIALLKTNKVGKKQVVGQLS